MHLRFIFIAILLTLPVMAALPAKATLTDTNGRVIEGAILAKSDKAITFQPTGNSKTFEIQLDTLSPDTQTFVQNLGKDDGKNKGIETLIEPGKVILAIPFEAQQRGGICAAASTINILKFLDPQLTLSQPELLSIFNDKRSGASPDQVASGIANLGFSSQLVSIDGDQEARKAIVSEIKRSLDKKQPLIAATSNHAMVLFGYDAKEQALYVWNQRGTNDSLPGMPKGTEKMTEGKFLASIKTVMFIQQGEGNTIACPIPNLENPTRLQFNKNRITNGNRRNETTIEFLEHAANPIILTHLRRGNRVFIHKATGKEGGYVTREYCEVTQITEGKWELKKINSNETIELSNKKAAENLYNINTGETSNVVEFISATPIK